MSNLNDVRLVVGMPCHDSVKRLTMYSTVNAMMTLKCPVQIHMPQGSIIHDNRNAIMQDSYEEGATHVLFLDSDVMFADDAMNQILEHRDRAIVGAAVNLKRIPIINSVKMADAEGNFINYKFETVPTEIFPCAGFGFGFCLVRLDAVKELGPRWFEFGVSPSGNTIGEDIMFCMKARRAGIEVLCDPNIRVGHIGEFTF